MCTSISLYKVMVVKLARTLLLVKRWRVTPCRRGTGRGSPAGVNHGGPRGAQVPGRGQELVLPAGDGLADTVAAARVRVHVLAFRGASGVRPRVRASVNREPQPAPPRARLPHLRRLLVRQARERASRSPSPMVSCSAIQARTCSPSASGGSSRVSSARERLLIEPAGIQCIRPRGQA